MISTVHHDHIPSARVSPGHTQSQLIGLAPGTDEIDNGKGVWEGGHQPVGVLNQKVVEIPGVGVQKGHLILSGPDDTWMVVPHMRDIVDAIQERLALLVIKELALSPDDFDRILVGDTQRRAQVSFSGFQDLLFRRSEGPGCMALWRLGRARVMAPPGLLLRACFDSVGYSQYQIGVRRQCFPQIPLGGEGHPGKVSLEAETIGDELEVKVLKIDHLGIAVNSIDEGKNFWTDVMGLEFEGTETVQEQKVTTAFFPVGESEVELLESTSPDGPIAKYLEKKGAGLQHIAFRVENIESALEELKEKGVRLIDETPRHGAGGAKIAFLHPKATGGILVELCER